MGIAGSGNIAKVVEGEVGALTGAHIESFDAEVYGVGTGIDGGSERLARADGCHEFEVGALHELND